MARPALNAWVIFAILGTLLTPMADGAAKAHHHHRKTAQKPSATPSASPSPAPTPVRALAPGELPLAAQGAFLIDALTGKTLYEKEPDHTLYPASTTKILTALLIIEAGDLDKIVIIEPEDTNVEESALEMKPGDRFTRLQLLYGLMLKSANDAALALARDNAGSIPAFADKMNVRAHELGASSGNFTNPHGLPDKNHFTTPRDLALIARAAMEQPMFRKIVSTIDYPLATPEGPVPLRNHNKLLTEYPGCNGVKTGYTVPAQQVLVAAALRDGREVISVVMHTDHPGIWDDSKTLLDYGFSHLSTFP